MAGKCNSISWNHVTELRLQLLYSMIWCTQTSPRWELKPGLTHSKQGTLPEILKSEPAAGPAGRVTGCCSASNRLEALSVRCSWMWNWWKTVLHSPDESFETGVVLRMGNLCNRRLNSPGPPPPPPSPLLQGLICSFEASRCGVFYQGLIKTKASHIRPA